jgi:hypothetical protein
MHAFLRRFLMQYGIYRRYPLGFLMPCISPCCGPDRSIRVTISTSPFRSAARTFLGCRGLRQPGEVHGPPPRLFLEKHSDRLRDPRIIPGIQPSHVLPGRVLDGEAGGMLDHAPRPRKAAGHFLGPPAALCEPNYHLRGFRTGRHPADLCRQHRRHHFGVELVRGDSARAPGEKGVQ